MELYLFNNVQNRFQMKSKKIFHGRFFLTLILAINLVAVFNGCKKDDNSPASSGTPPANEV
jgi:hypothetical protein